MLVAKKKRKENIVEYILYLYQVEDLIRVYKFDIDQIEKNLVAAYNIDDKTKKVITDWYANLLIMMQKEQLKEKGHLQFLVNLVNDVDDFHLKLLETKKDANYIQSYKAVEGLITELKTKNPTANNDIDLGLAAVYGYFLLKAKKQQISIDTSEAIKRIGKWLADLSKLYRDFENEDFEF